MRAPGCTARASPLRGSIASSSSPGGHLLAGAARTAPSRCPATGASKPISIFMASRRPSGLARFDRVAGLHVERDDERRRARAHLAGELVREAVGPAFDLDAQAALAPVVEHAQRAAVHLEHAAPFGPRRAASPARRGPRGARGSARRRSRRPRGDSSDRGARGRRAGPSEAGIWLGAMCDGSARKAAPRDVARALVGEHRGRDQRRRRERARARAQLGRAVEPLRVDRGGCGSRALSSRSIRKPLLVAPPSTTSSKSTSADARRARASSRVSPVAITFAISESKSGGTSQPAATPVSTRRRGPSAGSKRAMRPGAGRNSASGSSAQMRASMAQPARGRDGGRGSRSPRAMRICSSTRSRPVSSSVMPCSTCRRGFTSRKAKRAVGDQELDGADADVADGARELARRTPGARASRRRIEAGRRRLFEHLLVSALHGAVAAAERQHAAVRRRRRSAPRRGGRARAAARGRDGRRRRPRAPRCARTRRRRRGPPRARRCGCRGRRRRRWPCSTTG